jgi:uncharacterized protein YndB with AHSA1/START domain
MKRALIILGALAGLIIVVAIIGWLLPQSHTATAQRSFDSPAANVWRVITTVEDYPEWRPYVESVEVTSSPGEQLRWTEKWEGSDAVTFEVLEGVKEKKLVAAIVNDNLPFGGSWTYDIVSAGDGCTVTITENLSFYFSRTSSWIKPKP